MPDPVPEGTAADSPAHAQSPAAELAGRHVRLRPLREPDAGLVFEAVESSREALKRWLSWVPKAAGTEDEADFIRRSRSEAAAGESSVWGVFESRSGRFAGVSSLDGLSPAERGRGRFCAWVRADRRNRGYATEAGRLLLDNAFRRLGLHRIFARIDPTNRAGRRVIRKLGFRYEGRLRDDWKINGRWIDHECWGLLKTDWKR
ncbi:MAG: GNAT family N-acetyltransferase [Elusimicrobia bacterium]|nr:GNAT family N-acetyltransferase [Elusimicrobiota bacterium]